MTVRAGTKSAFAIAVMEKMADKPMDKVVPKIAEATGLDMDKAKHYYVLFVRKGLAPGVVPGKAPKAQAEPKAKAPKAPVKAAKPEAPKKSAEEIERIKAANMERMRAVMGKSAKRMAQETVEKTGGFAETDSFAAPAFLSKDEVSALV